MPAYKFLKTLFKYINLGHVFWKTAPLAVSDPSSILYIIHLSRYELYSYFNPPKLAGFPTGVENIGGGLESIHGVAPGVFKLC